MDMARGSRKQEVVNQTLPTTCCGARDRQKAASQAGFENRAENFFAFMMPTEAARPVNALWIAAAQTRRVDREPEKELDSFTGMGESMKPVAVGLRVALAAAVLCLGLGVIGPARRHRPPNLDDAFHMK